jgi:hypothetical protein
MQAGRWIWRRRGAGDLVSHVSRIEKHGAPGARVYLGRGTKCGSLGCGRGGGLRSGASDCSLPGLGGLKFGLGFGYVFLRAGHCVQPLLPLILHLLG